MTARSLPSPRSIYTSAHAGYCTAECFSKYNPRDLSYAVVKNGAVQKHHTGPHAQEMARSQAAQIREWATYMGRPDAVSVEEFAWTGDTYKRTDAPAEAQS